MTTRSRALFLAVLVPLAMTAGAQDPASAAKPVTLFDGTSLDGWTTGDGKPVTAGWVVEDGCIVRKQKGGDLFLAGTWSDFDLTLEWKIAEKGNSGIKYRFTSYTGGQNGPEYQLLDDEGHPDGKAGAGKRRTACLYDILPADTATVYRKPGEWNTSRIVARGPVVEHWLNGTCVLRYDSSTEDFRKAVQDSKFRKDADYAARPAGRILFQDHGDPVWFRSITLTDLAAPAR